MTKKIEIKLKQKEDQWNTAVESMVNGGLDVGIYPRSGEVYIQTGDDSGTSLVIHKNGTWELQ